VFSGGLDTLALLNAASELFALPLASLAALLDAGVGIERI
jgi:hypothetical protein